MTIRPTTSESVHLNKSLEYLNSVLVQGETVEPGLFKYDYLP
jgi:hypothetical protein